MQTVLQQQMNPHFIFNSLTSINHFVIQNKPLESSRYLTKFSTLIRKILDNSAMQKVTLAEEIETLQIYIDLELLRFKDKFSYSIKKGANIDPVNIKVIPFLIQPFIDRAIREHILNKSIKGTILIQFQVSNKYLICSIIDNGTNNEEIETKKTKLTKSGTQIAEQRIDVYNKQNRNKIVITHDVIKNHKNEVSGNKTTIKYPINQ
jgi:LytS/YehU family sensor histidine kinase